MKITENEAQAKPKETRTQARLILIPALRNPKAPRVVTVSGLMSFAKNTLGIDLPKITIHTNLAKLTRDGLLRNPARGLYLNTLAEPQPTIAELAPHLRDGAIISLQTVLGQAGILNNPTPWVTCVVPRSRMATSGHLDVDGTTFSFSTMNETAMCENLPNLTLQQYAHVSTATPEKALLDWIYLSKHSRKWSAPPRDDLDLDRVDHEAINVLAKAMGIDKEWLEFRDREKPTPATRKIPFQRPR